MTDEQAMLQRIASETRGLVAATLVELATGRVLASWSRADAFDLPLGSAYQAEMVQQQIRALGVLGLGGRLEDVLLTLGDQLHLVRRVGEERFVYLAAEREGTNLAILRACLARHLP
jgi:hypothetical protein